MPSKAIRGRGCSRTAKKSSKTRVRRPRTRSMACDSAFCFWMSSRVLMLGLVSDTGPEAPDSAYLVCSLDGLSTFFETLKGLHKTNSTKQTVQIKLYKANCSKPFALDISHIQRWTFKFLHFCSALQFLMIACSLLQFLQTSGKRNITFFSRSLVR